MRKDNNVGQSCWTKLLDKVVGQSCWTLFTCSHGPSLKWSMNLDIKEMDKVVGHLTGDDEVGDHHEDRQ
jgi:hypothetical protein